LQSGGVQLTRKRQTISVALGALVVGILIPLTVTAAGAIVSSDRYFGPIDGYSYYNQSSLYGPSSYTAGVFMGTSNYVNAPADYIGVQAELYEPGGHSCISSTWYYMASAGGGQSNVVYGGLGYCNGPSNYYSKGWTRAYNGNGYDTYGAYATPDMYLTS
jgi:hypothetical protein